VKAYKFDSILNYAPNLAFSWSTFNCCLPELDGCPRMFWFRKNPETKNLGIIEDAHLFMGRAGHEVIEAEINHRFNEGPEPDIKTIEEKHHLNEADCRDLSWALHNFKKNDPLKDYDNPVAELEIAIREDGTLCPWMDDKVYFRCKLDGSELITTEGHVKPNKALIDDWKFGRLIQPSPIQLNLYAWMLRSMYPTLESFDVSAYFVRENKEFSETFTDKDCNNAELWVKEKVDYIRTLEKFEANPGYDCQYCEFKHLCNDHAVLKTDTPENILKVLSQAKAFVKGVSSMMKDELKKVDIVRTGNMFAEMKPSETKSVALLPFVQLIADSKGVDDELECWKAAAGCLRIDTTSKEYKQLMKDPDLAEFVGDITTVKVSKRLYIGRVEEEPHRIPDMKPLLIENKSDVEAPEKKETTEPDPDLVNIIFDTIMYDTFTPNKIAEEFELTYNEACEIINCLVREKKILNVSKLTYKATRGFLPLPEVADPVEAGELPEIEFPKDEFNKLCKAKGFDTASKNALIHRKTLKRIRSMRGATQDELRSLCHYLLLNEDSEIQTAIDAGKEDLESSKKHAAPINSTD